MPRVAKFEEYNSGEVIAARTRLELTTAERIRQMVRHEISRHAGENDFETFEEADDFEFEDGEEWISPYEEKFEPAADPPKADSLGAGQRPAVTEDESQEP